MGSVAIGMEERDRDRADALVAEDGRRPADGRFVQGNEHRAVREHPFGDAEPQPAGDHRLREADEHVVDVVADLPGQLEDVAEALGREQSGLRPLAFEDDVGDEGSRVDHLAGPAQQVGNRAGKVGDAAHHRLLGRMRRGQGLLDQDGAVGIVNHREVGKGSADVDAEAIAGGHEASPEVCGIRGDAPPPAARPPFECSNAAFVRASKRPTLGIKAGF